MSWIAESRRHRIKRLQFEQLERREMLTVSVWDGDGGDLKWNTAENWSDDTVPGVGFDVLIETTGDAIQVESGTLALKSITSSRDVLFDGISATIDELLDFESGTEITVRNNGSLLASNANFDGVSLNSQSGSMLRFEGTSALSISSDTRFLATGAGSHIDLSSLTSIVNPESSPGFTQLRIEALGGAAIDLSNVSIAATEVDSDIVKAITLFARDANSLIDFSALEQFTDESVDVLSSFRVGSGGEIRVPNLGNSLRNVEIRIEDASSVFDVDSFTEVVDGSITVSGNLNQRTFAALGNISGTAIATFSGGQALMPVVAGVAITKAAGYTSEGAGSLIDLSAATELIIPASTGGNTELKLTALAGGKIDVSNVTRVETEQDTDTIKAITAFARDADSTIDFTSLTQWVDDSVDLNSTMRVEGGGAILAPNLSGALNNTEFRIAGETSLLELGALTSFTEGRVAIHGENTQRQFPSLIDITGTDLHVTGGATLSLPMVAQVDAPHSVSFRVEGANSLLDVSSVSAITLSQAAPAGNGIQIDAYAGGAIDLSSVTDIEVAADSGVRKSIRVFARDAGSSIDLSSLAEFVDTATHTNSGLRIGNGAAITLPSTFRELNHVDVRIDGATSQFPVENFTAITNAQILVDGASNSRSFSSLTDVTGTSLIAQAGASLRVPAVTAIRASRDVTLRSDGTDSLLDLATVTEIVVPEDAATAASIQVEAFSGGVVDLQNTQKFETEGSGILRSISVYSRNNNSNVDLSSLSQFIDSATHTNSSLRVADGAAIQAPLLVGPLNNVDLRIEGAESQYPAEVLTGLRDGRIHVAGLENVRVFPNLTDVNGTSLSAEDGGLLTLPGIATYEATSGASFFANGSNSILDLSAVTEVTIPPDAPLATSLRIEAFNGGLIDMSATESIETSLSAGVLRSVAVYARDSNSQVNLTSLRTFSDLADHTNSLLRVGNTGEILAPNLSRTLDNINLQIDDASSSFPAEPITRLRNGRVTVGGTMTDVAFPNLRELEGTSIYANGGASVSFPALSKLEVDSETVEILENGSESQIALPNLQTVELRDGRLTTSVNEFALSSLQLLGGVFTQAGQTEVRDEFIWIEGEIRGGGEVSLGEDSVSELSGNGVKTLGSTLINQGVLTHSGGELRLGPGNDEPGVIQNMEGATFAFTGSSTIVDRTPASASTFTNQGLLTQSGNGSSVIQVPFENTGSVLVPQGRLEIQDSRQFTVGDPALVAVGPQSRLIMDGSLDSSSTNYDLFAIRGRLDLSGGNFIEPNFIEVMSNDIGQDVDGFSRNFALGSVVLNEAYAKLVDANDNAPGNGTEALYLDTLFVGANSTLDLNGISVYVRATQIDGELLGGNATLIPDGGEIVAGLPTSGNVSTTGEVDNWTFSAAGQTRYIVELNLGNENSPPPLPPHLPQARLEVLDPDGNVIASIDSQNNGEPFALDFTTRNAGEYSIRVSGQESNTGRYVLTIHEAPFSTQGIAFNQQYYGSLQTPYAVEEWTFSSAPNQLIQFDLTSAAIPGMTFRLQGPNGWVGFEDIESDSELLTLPSAGQYRLQAYSNGFVDGPYAFKVDLVGATPLSLSVPYEGTIVGNNFVQLFELDLPEANSLELALEAPNNWTDIYVQQGAPPTPSEFDYRSSSRDGSDQLLIPFAPPGTWYVLLASQTTAGEQPFTLNAESIPSAISSITPFSMATGEILTATILGAGFVPGTRVRLELDDVSIGAMQVEIDAYDRITASFDLTELATGDYDVVVEVPNAGNSTLREGFEVLPVAEANLETRLIMPSRLGRHAVATLFVEYANTGNVAMPAPILVLQSSDEDGSDRPILTLDERILVDGFWSTWESEPPEGFDTSVQIYASGETPGMLQPGELIRMPVYYVGLLRPWDFADNLIEMQILIHSAEDTTLIDWDDFRSTLRPDWIDPEPWAIVGSNLESQIGATWGDYISTLSENANYLNRYSEPTNDVSQLYSFELQQAIGSVALGPLNTVTDAFIPAPGLPLTIGRSFGSTILDRFETGPLGQGWTSSWQTRLVAGSDGVVVIEQSSSSQRRFQEDSRRSGQFIGHPSDTGELRRTAGGAYQLSEVNGTFFTFRSDGLLDFVEDKNGNRITATYFQNQLQTLTHSSGSSLTFQYNSAGLISMLTESTGRVTRYTYDPTNTYLLIVSGPDGETTYTYETNSSSPALNALLSVADGSGIGQFFEYDDRGQLIATYIGNRQQELNYSYAVGKIATLDAAGSDFQIFTDHRNLVVRTEGANDGYSAYRYDNELRLTGISDALGRSQSFAWTGNGQLTELADEFGFTTVFVPGGPNGQPVSFVDANGNPTFYQYTEPGSLASTTYADGTVESAVYNEAGSVTQVTNRRGQTILQTRNAAGQLTQEIFPDGTSASYAYDAFTRLTSTTDQHGTTTLQYDGESARLARVDFPNGRWVRYEYDSAGRRTLIEDHSGHATKYEYDTEGRLFRLRDQNNALIIEYGYDSAGRLHRETKGNGNFSAYSYDTNGRVREIRHHRPNGALNARLTYTFNTVGDPVRLETLDGVWTYEYDLTSQLVRAEFASTNAQVDSHIFVYEYDALGNRIRTIHNGETVEYESNSLNQYRSVGVVLQEHDADGNLIRESGPNGIREYTYDYRNRLTRLTTPEGVWEYEYDLFGNRTAVTVDGERTEYLLDITGLASVLGEHDSGSNRTSSYHLGNRLEAEQNSGEISFYDFDALGSTIGTNTGGGAYQTQFQFSPFGEELLVGDASDERFRFVGAYGAQDDGSPVLYMRARQYSSESGRFTQQDRIRLDGGDTNLYRYVANRPNSLVDPAGTTAVTTGFFAGLGGAISGSVTSSPSGTSASFGIGFGLGASFGAGVSTGGPSTGFSGTGQAAIGAIGIGLTTGPGGDSVDVTTGFGGGGALTANFSICLVGVCDPGGGGNTGVAGAVDPNEKLGPAGYGANSFVPPDLSFPYRIDFENLGEGSIPTPAVPATAPAQRVVVTDQLSSAFDWSTLEFIEFGFGDMVVAFDAPSANQYSTVSVSRNGKQVEVQVELALDTNTGEVRAVFQTLEPSTDLPPDVLSGFLPPEDGTGIGQGYFSYLIRPKADLPSGTEIRNVATIVFDRQNAINTNQVDPQDSSQGTDPNREALITIDAGQPTSGITTPTGTSTTTTFGVSWSGQDDTNGSGIAYYDIFISENGGEFTPWLERATSTTAQYPGIDGNQYAFYSVATDNVGHREDAPTEPDSIITVDENTNVWHNADRPEDVNVDTFVSPIDALIIINDLNGNGSRALPPGTTTVTSTIDVNNDRFVSPIDALIVINFLNSKSNGEGELPTTLLVYAPPFSFPVSWTSTDHRYHESKPAEEHLPTPVHDRHRAVNPGNREQESVIFGPVQPASEADWYFAELDEEFDTSLNVIITDELLDSLAH